MFLEDLAPRLLCDYVREVRTSAWGPTSSLEAWNLGWKDTVMTEKGRSDNEIHINVGHLKDLHFPIVFGLTFPIFLPELFDGGMGHS